MPKSQQPIEGQELMRRGICQYVDHLPALRSRMSVIDVGAGADAKWGHLLKGETAIDLHALEIWPASAHKLNASGLYQKVINDNMMEFSDWRYYDVVIFGDVLEHVAAPAASILVDRLDKLGIACFLSIPTTECLQDGRKLGNPFETHLAQWTKEQLIAQGWTLLHEGPNPNGRVQIGTFSRNVMGREGGKTL